MRRDLPRRVGVYAGTFDPVHAGHIAFALEAMQTAKLDRVIFLPERRPRFKTATEHFGHRVAMLNRAVRPHPKLEVLELVDGNFTVKRTLPRLHSLFPGVQLVLLMGSDVVSHVPDWPDADSLLAECELAIGLRDYDQVKAVAMCVASWPSAPRKIHVCETYAAAVSSSRVRLAIRSRVHVPGVLQSVAHYARANWLYVALP